jgi:hypothetical protein
MKNCIVCNENSISMSIDITYVGIHLNYGKKLIQILNHLKYILEKLN